MPSDNYVIPLQKAYLKTKTTRSKRAINLIYSFLKKHTRKDKEDIVLSDEVNHFIWSRGIQKPPRRIVVSLRNENNKIYVFLKDSDKFKNFKVKKEKPKVTAKKGVAETTSKNSEKPKETTKDTTKETTTSKTEKVAVKEEKPKSVEKKSEEKPKKEEKVENKK